MLSTKDQDKEKTAPVKLPWGFFTHRRVAKVTMSKENKESNADAQQPSNEHDAPTVPFTQLFWCVLFFSS